MGDEGTPICWFIPHMLLQLGWDQTETGSRKFSPGLPRDWQGSICLSHLYLLSPKVCIGRKLESEVGPRLKPRYLMWNTGIPSSILTAKPNAWPS